MGKPTHVRSIWLKTTKLIHWEILYLSFKETCRCFSGFFLTEVLLSIVAIVFLFNDGFRFHVGITKFAGFNPLFLLMIPFLAIVQKSLDQESMLFHEFIKFRRQELGYSLRDFCRKFNEDPGNWSKMERGLLLAPQKQERLRQIASHLEIQEDSKEWQIFMDTALISKGVLMPSDNVKGDENFIRKLPVFFAELRKHKKPTELLDELLKIIKDSES